MNNSGTKPSFSTVEEAWNKTDKKLTIGQFYIATYGKPAQNAQYLGADVDSETSRRMLILHLM